MSCLRRLWMLRTLLELSLTTVYGSRGCYLLVKVIYEQYVLTIKILTA